MRFAAYAMIFDQQKWVMRYLENVYPHVDRIYLSYSKLPWGYNPEAREKYVNTFDLDLVRKSEYMDKVVIIEGDWMSDADQRNSCLDKAKSDRIDYLIALDTDEFLFHKDFEKLKKEIVDDPSHDAYELYHYDFWKSFNYILIEQNPGPGRKVINVKTTGYYDQYLNTHPQSTRIINDILYYHGSYVLTNEECYKKIKTWTHHNDFNVDKWYNEVWLTWIPESKDLHPIWPWVWSHAEKFDGELPEALKGFGDGI